MLKILCMGTLLTVGGLTGLSWSAGANPGKLEDGQVQNQDADVWQSDAVQRHRHGQGQHWRALVLVRN